jgi:hypothetical protein
MTPNEQAELIFGRYKNILKMYEPFRNNRENNIDTVSKVIAGITVDIVHSNAENLHKGYWMAVKEEIKKL